MSVFIGYPSFMAYQMMKGKKGNNDGFPSIPGMIARYSALGFTNEQMAENPVWKDLIGNGHDLQMKNFAWSRMSGCDGYTQNFNQYAGLSGFDKTVNDSSVKVFIPQDNNSTSFYDSKSREIGYTYNFYIKVTGIENRELRVINGTKGGTVLSIKQDGVYLINTIVSDDWEQNRLYFSFPKAYSNNTIIIKQLPLYPGALVFDGVDDYGVCENFPILTKEKGYTVVALRQYLSNATDKIRSLVTNAPTDIVSRSTLTFELIGSIGEKTNFSFGKSNPVSDFEPNVFSYMTSRSYNGKTITPGDVTESNRRLLVGNFSKSGKYGSNVAIWELVFLDHDATEEELTKIKDYFVKTYPWLFPDQAWTVGQNQRGRRSCYYCQHYGQW